MTPKVAGENSDHRVVLYTLSTCGWCKRTKQFLNDYNVEYEYLDLDTATSQERIEAIQFLQEKNVPIGFPVIVVDGETIISGYKPDKIKEALGF